MISAKKRISENPLSGMSGYTLNIDVIIDDLGDLGKAPLPFADNWILDGGVWDDSGIWTGAGLWQ